MKIIDEGIYLFSKKHGEKFLILSIFSRKFGIVRGLSRISKKSSNLINLDIISFELNYKNKETYGFIKFDLYKANQIDKHLFLLVKASASELCLKFLPMWEENSLIYDSLYKLSLLEFRVSEKLILEYIKWEYKFLEYLGYGLNFRECSETGSKNVHFISPKSGNCVCYEVGKIYEKKLFVIPHALKTNFSVVKKNDLQMCLNISGHFLKKISENKVKYIFRDQLAKLFF